MTAIDPAEFYAANIDKEKEYIHIHAAYKIKAGEEIEMVWHRKATEDGYEFEYEFMTEDEFAERTTPAGNLELPLPKIELSEDERRKFIPVKRGDKFVIDNTRDPPSKAFGPQDGFIMEKETGFDYTTGFCLASRFNYAGHNPGMEKTAIFTWKSERPFKGIVLEAETTFIFRDSEKTVGAGSVLILAPEHEGGFKLMHTYPDGTNSINNQLRLTAACTAQIRAAEKHEAANEKQAKLNARARRIKPR